MDFKKELSKFGYNEGNSVSVETLVDEILPHIFKEINNKSYIALLIAVEFGYKKCEKGKNIEATILEWKKLI